MLTKIARKKIRSPRRSANHEFANQYRKFRQIYNITKHRGMYLEQSEYFYLMQRCIEKNTDNPFSLRLFSMLYRWFSGYGQSVKRPLIIFASTYLVAELFYYEQGINNWWLAPFKQIVKPYNLLFETHQSSSVYLICLISTTFSLASLAMLSVALRWNFRKA